MRSPSVVSPGGSPEERRRAGLGAAPIAMALTLAVAVWAGAQPACGQAKPAAAKAADVFDDAPGGGEAKKPAEAKKETVTDREKLGFTQENVAAQMSELEERMFRLSEALRGLEPENASRLRLALKFSREEQILDQMRETNGLLKEAQIGKAETEVKELIAKLEHLRNLLLAEDLDFQLKLARLRQMRETLSQLERIVKEERRELGWSRFAIEQRKGLARLSARRPDLEALVRDQKALVDDLRAATNEKANAEPDDKAREAFRTRESKLRNAAAALAADPVFADLQPPHLRRADPHLGDAVSLLAGTDVMGAADAADRALGQLREELSRLDEQTTQAERTVVSSEFERRVGDQTKNRVSTDTLAEVSARLGDAGVVLRKNLIHASSSMRSAEQGLAKTAAEPAADYQSSALDMLTRSQEDLGGSIEKLLVELRTELQARLIGELTEMHELQASIRETTEAQAPRVAKKSRSALIVLAGLSKNEAELGERTEHLLGLVEETDFGIALPTTLRVLSREMRVIESLLKKGDASATAIALETRVEEDLLGLLQAIRRLPPSTPPPPGTPLPADARERERELNRMIAELKMIRMLQARLNDDTVGVDKTRPAKKAVPPVLRREIETLESTQDEIRESLARIAERIELPDENQ